MRLNKRCILITGAASGIGLAMSERFAREGATVAMVDRDGEALEAQRSRLADAGLNVLSVTADLADAAQLRAAVTQAAAAMRGLDTVVNNAAVILPKSVDEVTVEEFDALMAVNLRAPFLVVQAALAWLRPSRGVVLNIASTAAIRMFERNTPYIASKGGLIALTQAMACEFRKDGIRVNCLCPGGTDTPLARKDAILRNVSAEAIHEGTRAGVVALPAVIAAAALGLIDEDSRHISGAVVPADGGLSLG